MKNITKDFPSRGYYEKLWEKVINKCIEKYCSKYVIMVDYNAKEEIWECYRHFNAHCKMYMSNPEEYIDRHKVAACYMYAVLSAKVLSCQYDKPSAEDVQLRVNEHLAIATGLSVLRAMIFRDLNDKRCILSDQEKNEVRVKLNGGFKFPMCNHGEYEANLATSLYYTRKEHNYNILSLADRLYFIEFHNTGIDCLLKID